MSSFFYKIVSNNGLTNSLIYLVLAVIMFVMGLLILVMIGMMSNKLSDKIEKINDKTMKHIIISGVSVIVGILIISGVNIYTQYGVLTKEITTEYTKNNQLVMSQLKESDYIEFQEHYFVLKLNTKSEIQIDKKTKQLITSDADAQFLLFADKKLNEMNIKLKPESIEKVDQFTYSGIDAKSNETVTITNENTANIVIN